MTALDVMYREALLPIITDIRRPGGSIDLNACEEVLSPRGLHDLDRAARVAVGLLRGRR